MFRRALVAVLCGVLFAACGRSQSPSENKLYLNQSFPSLCKALETAGKFALSLHVQKGPSDYGAIRIDAAKNLARGWNVEAPEGRAENCEDLKSIAAKRAEKGESVQESDLYAAAFNSFVSLLDPHSFFLPTAGAEQLEKRDRNEGQGLGIVLKRRLFYKWVPVDQMTIEEVFVGSPAWNVLRPGEKIVGVNGKSLKGMSFDDAQALINGSSGTVKLQLDGESDEVSLAPAPFRSSPVMAARMDRSGVSVGYLKLREFTKGASQELVSHVKDFERSDGVKGFILDLRGDPGGGIQEAADIVGIFRGPGKVASLHGAPDKKFPDGLNPNSEISAQNETQATGLPLVILINQASASASEVVVGSLWTDRALVVGERTFGKGTGQIPIHISPKSGLGGLLLLTMFRTHLSDGFSPQVVGVSPHVSIIDAALQMVVQERRAEGKDVRLLEEDLGRERLVSPPKEQPNRLVSAATQAWIDEIKTRQAAGDFAHVCNTVEDCQLEMAIAFLTCCTGSHIGGGHGIQHSQLERAAKTD